MINSVAPVQGGSVLAQRPTRYAKGYFQNSACSAHDRRAAGSMALCAERPTRSPVTTGCSSSRCAPNWRPKPGGGSRAESGRSPPPPARSRSAPSASRAMVTQAAAPSSRRWCASCWRVRRLSWLASPASTSARRVRSLAVRSARVSWSRWRSDVRRRARLRALLAETTRWVMILPASALAPSG